MKKLTRILSVLVVLAMLACIAPAAFAAEESVWTSLTEHYVVNADGTVTSTGACESILEKTNFCLRNDYIATGDYAVSVKMQGTMGMPNTMHVQEGIIPWYVDANNFLFVYVEWAPNERPNDIRQMHVSGKVNGEHLGWGDLWCDGIHVAQNSKLTLKVEKITEGTDVKLAITLLEGENVVKTGERVFAGKAEAMNAEGKMGVYAFGDTVTFSNFTSTAQKAETEEPEQPQEPVSGWNSLTEHYTVNADGTVTSTGACEGLPDKTNFCLSTDYIATGDYTVSVKMQGTMGMPNTKHVQEGIIPWYVDENNFLYIYVEWAPNERPNDIRQMHVSGKVNGEFLGWGDLWCDGIHVAQNSELTLKVEKITEGADVKLVITLLEGENVVKTGERVFAGKAEAMNAEGKMGVYAFGDTVTFSNFTSTAQKAETEEPEQPVDPPVDPVDPPVDPVDPPVDPENPSTGDNLLAVVLTLVMSGAAVLVLNKKRR